VAAGRRQDFLGEHEEASGVALGNRRGSGAHLNGVALAWSENRASGGGFNVGSDLR
jgi:hypothetical protein